MSSALVALGHLHVRKVIPVVFSVSRTLIGQTVVPFGNESDSQHVPSELGKNLVWAIWLMLAFLITNSYLGVFKSNYIFDPQCSRNWSSLLDMGSENVTLIFGYTASSLTRIPEKNSDLCLNAFDRDVLQDNRKPCIVSDVSRDMEALGFEQKHVEDLKSRFESLESLEERLEFVPIEKIREVIRNKLGRPRTVFVSPLHCFESDWQYFRQAMRKYGVKFARHHEPTDRTLERTVRYGFTTGLHSWHEKLVPRRLRTLVTSGIFQVWTKWEQLRMKTSSYESSSETEVLYLPLSMESSDLHLVFKSFTLLLFASGTVFLYELIVKATIIEASFVFF